MNLGDIFFRAVIKVDPNELKKSATAAGAEMDKAGLEKKGQSIGDVFKNNVSGGFKIAGTAAAAGFAMATKGALEAESAQGKYMAATGGSREEAKAFVSSMDSLAGKAGTVNMSFDELSSVGAEVARQFQLTGQAGADATLKFAQFGTVTGSDATAAVKAMDAALDAFHLPAEAASETMDKLIASNQKYGTDVGPEVIDQLAKMAPALQNVGASLDDGIGLLNMFEASGLSTSAAMKGLVAATKNMPDGMNLNQFMQHLQDLKDKGIDPTSEAVTVFGQKAGVGIANAIQPGQKGLQGYTISADEAKNAVSDAAEAMMTTGDKIKAGVQKLMAGAREIGNEFGPAVTGLASLTSLAAPFAKGIGSMLKTVVGLILPQAVATGAAEGEAQAAGATGPRILQSFLAKFGLLTGPKVAASVAAGTAEGAAEGEAAAAAAAGPAAVGKFKAGGTLLGGAMGSSILVAIGAAIGLGLDQVIIQQEGQLRDIVKKFQADLGNDPLLAESAAAAKGPWSDYISVLGQGFKDFPLFGSASTRLGEDLTNLGGSITGAKNSAINAFTGFNVTTTQLATGGGHSAGEAYVQAWGDATHDGMSDHISVARDDAAAMAKQQATTYEETIKGNRNSLSLWEITRQKQVADSKAWEALWDASARSVTGDMAGTLRGSKDEVGSAMDDLMYTINHPLKLQKEINRVQGQLNSKTLKDALASSNPEIKAQAEQTQARLEAIMAQLNPAWKYAADAASTSLEDNLNNGYPGALTDVRNFRDRFNDILAGLTTNKTVNVSVARGLAGKLAHMPQFAGGGRPPLDRPSIVGEEGWEFFQPDTPGRIMSHTDSVAALREASAGTSVGLGSTSVRHEGRLDIGLTPEAAAALRAVGFNDERVADMIAVKLETVLRTSNSQLLDTSGRPVAA